MSADGSLVPAARARVDRIKAHVSAAREELIEAWRQRDWISLGYPTWDAMCEAEFDGVRIALSIEDRRDIVGELRDEGMSTRAIGSALGVDQATVVRDLHSTDASASVEEVTSLDGKKRPAAQPPRAEDSAPRTPTVDELLERDADVIAARKRHELAKYIAALSKPLDDPIEMARLDPERIVDIERAIDRLTKWAKRFRAALPQPAPVLQMVKES